MKWPRFFLNFIAVVVLLYFAFIQWDDWVSCLWSLYFRQKRCTTCISKNSNLHFPFLSVFPPFFYFPFYLQKGKWESLFLETKQSWIVHQLFYKKQSRKSINLIGQKLGQHLILKWKMEVTIFLEIKQFYIMHQLFYTKHTLLQTGNPVNLLD